MAETGDDLRHDSRMTLSSPPPQIPIRVFMTRQHPCGYYPERLARNLVLDPSSPYLASAYASAIDHGFRRSGAQVYRPHCQSCDACMATRIDVAAFVPDRSQRRALARNTDLEMRLAPPVRTPENYELYSKYLASRHGDGPMAESDPDDFLSFLTSDWSRTVFMELRREGKLVAVAVTDLLPQGISAVYTFYDTSEPKRSLGTVCILRQIELAYRRQLPWLYLGYWLEGHPKMDYKCRYSAMQVLRDSQWQPMT